MRCASATLLVLLLSPLAGGAAERAAEVITVQGVGERREDERSAWRSAAPKHELFDGHFVRTGAYSRMALLFADRTQVRLSEKTLLQVKSPTLLRLERGRSWSQTNRIPANLYLETPSATAAIRGTDWEIEVGEDGAALLSVFSGEVEFFNDFGRVRVARNEQAQAQPGRAPVKLLLANPRERVQWVTAYVVEPARHIPAGLGAQEAARLEAIAERIRAEDYESAVQALQEELPRSSVPAPYLMLSDLMVAQGRLERATDYAQSGLARFAGDARLLVQLARVRLAAGDFAAAREHIGQALRAEPASADAQVAAGDVARAGGEAAAARAAYEAALASHRGEDRAWFGLGVVDSEREAVAPARRSLGRALELNAEGPGYRGELGTLESFANNFQAAEASFRAALERNPGDYVALTGLGVMQLKRGRPEQALESFLRASVLEPRYARARMYAGVAHYQLGRRELALRELERAAELDDKDPMPHLFASMVHTDHFRPAEAIAASRAALERLPYLKSLNQVANDQKGSANLGRSLAFFGLEEWAQNYAQESYYPYWAGSHLFLSDRYAGAFNKNSELLQGFLTDPTVFGAGNRFQPLVTTPGNYARLFYAYSYAEDQVLRLPAFKVNGLADLGMPVAYLVDFERPHFDLPGPTDFGVNKFRTWTLAAGARPTHELGVFAYGFDDFNESGFDLRRPAIVGNLAQRMPSSLAMVGINYKFAPTSQIWARLGQLSSQPQVEATLNGLPIRSKLDSSQPESGLRHTFSAGAHELTWGLETMRRRSVNDWNVDFGGGLVFINHDVYEDRARNVFLSDRLELGPRLLVQGDLWLQRVRRTLQQDPSATVPAPPPTPPVETIDLDQPHLRAGLRYRVSRNDSVRLAYQSWVKPLGLSTLGPVATAGIPIDDRLVSRGGTLRRVRAQFDSEASSRSYWTAFIDRKDIKNRFFSVTPFLVEEDDNLTKLRDFDFARLSAGDLYEFVSPRDFSAGRATIGGGAVNRILSERWSASTRYQLTDSTNTGPTAPGKKLPYLAQHAGSVGATWASPSRFYFISRAIYRSARYTDEANTDRLPPGWAAGFDVFWESRDKRARARLGVDNAFNRVGFTQYFATLVFNL